MLMRHVMSKPVYVIYANYKGGTVQPAQTDQRLCYSFAA